MAAYLIVYKDCDDWDLPVFYAGDGDREEAIAVFTGCPRAAKYLRDAGLQEDHEVCEVSAIELFEMMVKAHEEGVGYVAVNPNRKQQLAGRPQPVIALERQLTRFAERLWHDVVMQ
jgi:hypothetical protein